MQSLGRLPPSEQETLILSDGSTFYRAYEIVSASPMKTASITANVNIPQTFQAKKETVERPLPSNSPHARRIRQRNELNAAKQRSAELMKLPSSSIPSSTEPITPSTNNPASAVHPSQSPPATINRSSAASISVNNNTVNTKTSEETTTKDAIVAISPLHRVHSRINPSPLHNKQNDRSSEDNKIAPTLPIAIKASSATTSSTISAPSAAPSIDVPTPPAEIAPKEMGGKSLAPVVERGDQIKPQESIVPPTNDLSSTASPMIRSTILPPKPTGDLHVYLRGNENVVGDFSDYVVVDGSQNTVGQKTTHINVSGSRHDIGRGARNVEVHGYYNKVKHSIEQAQVNGSYAHATNSGENVIGAPFEVRGIKKQGKAQKGSFLMVGTVSDRGIAFLYNPYAEQSINRCVFTEPNAVVFVTLRFVITNIQGVAATGIASNTLVMPLNGCGEWKRRDFNLVFDFNAFTAPISFQGVNGNRFNNSLSIQIDNGEGNGEIELLVDVETISLQYL